MAFWWRARYEDGVELVQFPPEGGERLYKEIDRVRLKDFEVWDGDRLRLVCHPNPGGSLIYRKRHTIKITSGKEERSVVILVGWRQQVGTRQAQAVAAVFEDGHVEIAPGFKAGDPWLYAPTPHPEEGEEVQEFELLEFQNPPS